MKTVVWITTKFAAFHRWASAPDPYAFLRDYHRHLFHVRLGVSVGHGDREVEFFDLKARLEEYLRESYTGKQFELSCEQIASEILIRFRGCWCEVSEDGENGATVEQTPITEVVRTKCFVGTEAEGPNRGVKTLFIPGSCSPEEVSTAAGKTDALYAYYGAGNDRKLREDTLKRIRSLFPDNKITVELDRSFDVPNSVTVVTLDVGIGADFRKTVSDGMITWICNNTGQKYLTRVDDPMFLLDKELL